MRELFYFEVPSIDRKDEAIGYIKEFYQYNSKINGSGGLDKYLDDYQGWLNKLENDYKIEPSNDRVPSRTYFLIRKNDNKIIGMINIRLALNDWLRKFGGNIGYSIRPTERGKGYNKINLYLGLQVCQQYGLDKVLLDADKNNPASWRTMEALGGICIKEWYDNEFAKCIVKNYEVDVDKSINKYREVYSPMIYEKTYQRK